ncbi:MAG: O-antigen ligase family protein, partial [Luteimonas sp.]
LLREAVAIGNHLDVSSVMPAVHLLYCLIVFNVLRRAFLSPTTVSSSVSAITLAAFVAILGILYFGYGPTADPESYGDRAIGTFNNPNQLGYFSVCLFSIASLLRLVNRITSRRFVILVAIALLLAVASLSKAAMVSLGCAAAFSAFVLVRNRRLLVIGWAIALFLVVAAWYMYSAGAFDGFAFIDRLKNIGSQSDDSLAGRGYIPWFQEGPVIFLFGTSFDGALQRIQGHHEVHSTLASFFIEYGMLGGMLFLSFVLIWIKRIFVAFGWVGLVLVCMPVMMFGLTHNGSRFTVFWVLISISFAITEPLNRTRARAPLGMERR